MKIELLGWSCEGIRAADMKIDLTNKDSEVTKLSLILLDNSGGKTTTTELIRDTLSGRTESYDEEQIMHFADEERLDNDNGFFQLDVRLDGEVYNFINNFNFKEKTVQVITKGGQLGTQHKWAPPSRAQAFLDNGLVNLYIYDGEQTKYLMDERRGDVETVVDNIYQLTEFEKIKIILDSHLEDEQKKAKATITNKSALNALETKIKKLKSRREELEDKYKKCDKDIIEANKNIERLNKEKKDTSADTDKKSKRLEEIKNEIKDCEVKNNQILIEILQLYKHPFSISKSIENEYRTFRKNLDEQKLPESSTRAFFEETAKKDECICGEPLDQRKKDIILKKSEAFMGDEYTEFLNAMKSSVSESIITIKDDHQELLDEKTKELKVNNDALYEKNNEKDEFSAAIQGSSGRSFKDIDEEINKERETKIKAEMFKEKYFTTNQYVNKTTHPESINSVGDIDKLIASYEAEMNLGQSLSNLRKKIDLIKSLIDRCKEKTKVNIKTNLINRINEDLKKTVNQGIPPQIESLDGYIKLKSKLNLKDKKVNVGAELAVAYVFLITALKEADQANQFPLFVDSPANSIGSSIRENIAKLVMANTSQFICLIQLGERDFFVNKLDEYSKGNSNMYTVFRKTKETQKYLNNNSENLKEYNNSAVVTGLDFLNKFYIPGTV